ncbi:hypothetical protein BMI86_13855 [Thioclava sp. DLFJ5-1]|nr:hypothetical protein BMI86_13855 [Thioclava sp. DLFJ5-1]
MQNHPAHIAQCLAMRLTVSKIDRCKDSVRSTSLGLQCKGHRASQHQTMLLLLRMGPESLTRRGMFLFLQEVEQHVCLKEV